MSKTQWGLVMGESLEMTAGGRVTEEVGWLWRTWWGGGQGIVVTNIKSERDWGSISCVPSEMGVKSHRGRWYGGVDEVVVRHLQRRSDILPWFSSSIQRMPHTITCGPYKSASVLYIHLLNPVDNFIFSMGRVIQDCYDPL